MIIDFNAIENAKHIVITTDSAAFSNASAMYSYILTLHKKVSLHNFEELEPKFSFLPWFDKSREKLPSSGDLVITMGCETKELYELLVENKIKINVKMATALYAGMLLEFKSFKSPLCDGMVFAIVSELIALKADYQKCRKYLLESVALSNLRLKAELFKSLLHENEATHAKVYVSDAVLNATGASLKDAFEIMDDVLALVHVEKVTLYKSDENCKILKEI